MPLDPQVERFLRAAAAVGEPNYATLTPEEARSAHLETIGHAGPAEDVESVVDRSIPGPYGSIPVRIYRPRDAMLPTLVYFHGGGWVVGNLDTVDVPLRAVSNRADCAIVSVDCRQAPEHKFPIPLDEARAAVDWVRTRGSGIGLDPTHVAIGGDSAGGNLTAAVSLATRGKHPPLVAEILVYPVTNFSLDTGSYEEFADGYGLTRESMKWYWNHYLPDRDSGAEELASPLRAKSLAGLPPTLVITAEYDPLRDEGEAFAARLRAAGVDVRLSRYHGMIHGFFRMGGVIDAAHRAVDEIASFLLDRWRATGADVNPTS
jgi:acetyl esterase